MLVSVSWRHHGSLTQEFSITRAMVQHNPMRIKMHSTIQLKQRAG